MSDQPSAFETPATLTEQPTTAPAAPAPVATPAPAFSLSDQTQAFVGEGKKYNSAQTALDALPHQQSHIETLESENARLRADLERSSTLDDAVSRIEASNVQTARPATPEVQANVRDEARSVYEEMTAESITEANVASVNNAMFEMYGEKSPLVTKSVAEKLGVPVSFLLDTAKASPQAYLTLISENNKGNGGMPVLEQSTINASAIDSQSAPDAPSAKVSIGSNTTKDLVKGWRGAGEIVAKNNT